jgi:hypothetical protein
VQFPARLVHKDDGAAQLGGAGCSKSSHPVTPERWQAVATVQGHLAERPEAGADLFRIQLWLHQHR